MRILSLHHVPFEGLGFILGLIESGNHALHRVNLWENDDLPDLADFDLMIVMGGPMSVGATESFPWLSKEKRFISEAIDRGKRALGICLGAQLIAEALGATVASGLHREIGWYTVTKEPDADRSAVGRILPDRFPAFHWHGESFSIPPGAIALGHSEAYRNQGFAWDDRVTALQFHLEATPRTAGALLKNCAGELAAGGPYVQDTRTIAGNKSGFEKINGLMERIWTTLVV